MKKLFIIGLVFILLLPFVSATCFSGENCTLWASIYNGSLHFNSTNATIEVYTGDNIFVVNDTMQLSPNKTGVYQYIFIFNDTGNYYYKASFFLSGVKIAEADNSFTVELNEDQKMSGLTIVIGLGFLILVFIYASSQIKSQEVPKGRVPEKMTFYAWTLGGVLMLIGFLYVYTRQNNIVSYFETQMGIFFSISMILTIAIVGFFLIYIIENVFKEKPKDDFDDDD